VLQVQRFGAGERLSLSGPGIAGRAQLAAEPLPLDFQDRLAANHTLFPRGVDVVLVSPEAVAALPRSVTSERG
jgi:alpha-D-ribose 1-methylphosphonate 5-triphosphate synthase subunit PhnH